MEYKSNYGVFQESSNWYEFCKDRNDFIKGYKKWKRHTKAGKNTQLSEYFEDGRLKQAHRVNRPKKCYNVLRQLRVALATPKWVNIEGIESIYYSCPEGLEVDHIIPLVNKNVSGLHVPWNLQYLSREENSKKRNRINTSTT